jgi:hypothetical protein
VLGNIARFTRTRAGSDERVARRLRRCAPEISPLEGRQLLSQVAAAHPASAMVQHVHAFPNGEAAATAASHVHRAMALAMRHGGLGHGLARHHAHSTVVGTSTDPPAVSPHTSTPAAQAMSSRVAPSSTSNSSAQPSRAQTPPVHHPLTPTDPDGDGDVDRGDFIDLD